ncbi:lytic transglycosylase domain-containing protein [Paenibacillus sp. NPDC058177]|uniref:lytic transglycosylase domain-containing protein n=1 Tax=Paenibacillus sp. NPDC058177 TaxID=3346369 RepID=UPI0036DF5CD0
MIKKIILTLAIAVTITACSPQGGVLATQATPAESVIKAHEPVQKVNNQETISPKIKVKTIAATVPASTHTSKQKPQPTKAVSTVERNLINHMTGQKVSKTNASKWTKLIIKHCNAYGVDPYTILAMIQVESGYNPNEVGPSHDTGLLQILPSTQKYMRISGSLFNPSINIEIGAKYLAYNQKRFGKDLGIIAYNQGEGNLSRGTYSKKYLARVNKVLATIER